MNSLKTYFSKKGKLTTYLLSDPDIKKDLINCVKYFKHPILQSLIIIIYIYYLIKIHTTITNFATYERFNYKKYDYNQTENTTNILTTYNDYENSCVTTNSTNVECVYVTKNKNLKDEIFITEFLILFMSFLVIPISIIFLITIIKIKLFSVFGNIKIFDANIFNNDVFDIITINTKIIPKSINSLILACYYDENLKTNTCVMKRQTAEFIILSFVEIILCCCVIFMVSIISIALFYFLSTTYIDFKLFITNCIEKLNIFKQKIDKKTIEYEAKTEL